MVTAEVVESTMWTSSHFLWASMIRRNILPWKGPAQSRWSWHHGISGHSHGCKGAGAFWWTWHISHLLALFSKSASNLSHHTKLLARLYILEMPWCPAWSSSITNLWPGSGTTTLCSHKMQPSCKLSSSFLCRYGWSSSSLAIHMWAISLPLIG